ncbi:ORF53 [Pieris rapae granulovirus]|nr:ORF53 [Pieris rapae granulovirus]
MYIVFLIFVVLLIVLFLINVLFKPIPIPEFGPTPNPETGRYGYNYPDYATKSMNEIIKYINNKCETDEKYRNILFNNGQLTDRFRCHSYFNCNVTFRHCEENTFFSFSLQDCVPYEISDCGMNEKLDLL